MINYVKNRRTHQHDQPFYLSKTNGQSKMADIVNILVYNRHVCQHNRKIRRKSNICNSRNLKITVMF